MAQKLRTSKNIIGFTGLSTLELFWGKHFDLYISKYFHIVHKKLVLKCVRKPKSTNLSVINYQTFKSRNTCVHIL